MASFLAEDDSEFMSSLRERPQSPSCPSAQSAHAAAAPAQTTSTCLGSNHKGEEEHESSISGWSLQTKPAPVGHTYQRTTGRGVSHCDLADRIETIGDIFGEADSLDFEAILSDYSCRPPAPRSSPASREPPSARPQSPLTSRSLDASDLLDQIFS